MHDNIVVHVSFVIYGPFGDNVDHDAIKSTYIIQSLKFLTHNCTGNCEINTERMASRLFGIGAAFLLVIVGTQAQGPYGQGPSYYSGYNSPYGTPNGRPFQTSYYGGGGVSVQSPGYQSPPYGRPFMPTYGGTSGNTGGQTQTGYQGNTGYFLPPGFVRNQPQTRPFLLSPSSGVVPPSTEGWTNWSQFSSCCQGVKYRMRVCRNLDAMGTPPCDGPAIDFLLCGSNEFDACVKGGPGDTMTILPIGMNKK
ncbi:uncharacterized protein LOC106155720 [Lingula anatina]|uniref:Uncharacterized protein LOC106155720 n=1 Tax=Lingula anatina TaxID=7574 RepID=A0A1S3HM84_LINAN|nr:uncharacterized protein LOC106155720 [Lingula anatina]|eukprot:XP_013386144.1 uncharacterized protein LOC106155720 [Lingula anatina]